MEKEITGYSLSRAFFQWSFDNPLKVSTNHVALYFYIIEHCNMLGWKSQFGLPSSMAMEAIGIKSYKTYIQTLRDLIDFGFVKMYQKSENQYTANIIGLVEFTEPLTKSLTKALPNHIPNQVQTTYQTNDSIDKLLNLETIKPKNKETIIGDKSPKRKKDLSIKPFNLDDNLGDRHLLDDDVVNHYIMMNSTIDEFLQNVRRIPSQITLREFANLYKKYYYADIIEMLTGMHNNSKYWIYETVYFAINKWLKKDYERNNKKGPMAKPTRVSDLINEQNK